MGEARSDFGASSGPCCRLLHVAFLVLAKNVCVSENFAPEPGMRTGLPEGLISLFVDDEAAQ
jgi:hypothetical protein